ncbi:MAG: o-succinylbenzoate synthase, partial [Endozoicomonas sp.]
LEEAFTQLQALCNEPGSFGLVSLKNVSSSVVFGIEAALWWLQQTEWLPAPVNAPLLEGSTDVIVQSLKQWGRPWPREFKLKIGSGSLEEDRVRICKVLDCLPESVRLKLDANQRWTFQQALCLSHSLERFSVAGRIAYIEEPTGNVDEFPEFYRCTGIPYALDETVQSPDYRFSAMPGLVALILKPTLAGGLSRCQQLIQEARHSGVRAIISSSFESSLGLHVLQQLSAAWTPGELPGLDTVGVFQHNIMTRIVTRIVSRTPESGQPIEVFSTS